MSIDLPTTEGTLALARVISSGAKLVIDGAVVCRNNGTITSASDAASATWGATSGGIDFSGTVVAGATPFRCTSYLPTMVSYENGSPVAALDIEFTWMPQGNVTYDSIAVLAHVYYEFVPFHKGSDYMVGDTVWYMRNDGTYEYYRCHMAVQNSDYPMNDSTHWEVVQPSEPSGNIAYIGGSAQYKAIDDTPVLLYLSIASNEITVSPEMEVDYKVRLYLDGVDTSEKVKDHVIFDTLGPEFMGSAQLALLANFAQQLRNIRDVAMARVAQGG